MVREEWQLAHSAAHMFLMKQRPCVITGAVVKSVFIIFFNTTGVTALLTGTVTPGQAGLHIIAASHVHIKMICGGVNLSSESLCKGGLRDKQR